MLITINSRSFEDFIEMQEINLLENKNKNIIENQFAYELNLLSNLYA